MRTANALVGVVVLGAMVVGCGSHGVSPIERAEYRYWVKQYPGITSVCCDQRGGYVKVGGLTYSGYLCERHGGGSHIDTGTFGAWWDGRKIIADCVNLPTYALNRLCFD
jgi:hypothetical protein